MLKSTSEMPLDLGGSYVPYTPILLNLYYNNYFDDSKFRMKPPDVQQVLGSDANCQPVDKLDSCMSLIDV